MCRRTIARPARGAYGAASRSSRLAAFDAPKQPVLYQADTQTDAAFALWPTNVQGETVEVAYRFTGLFGRAPNIVGLLLSFTDERNYAAFEFQMGVAKDRKAVPSNQVHLVQCVDGKAATTHGTTARGDWYNDGLIHRVGARHGDGQWTLTIDGADQFAADESLGRPCGVIVRRASVAIYEVDMWQSAVQRDNAPLDVQVGKVEAKE